MSERAAWVDSMAEAFAIEVLEARVVDLGPVEASLVRARLASRGAFLGRARPLDPLTSPEGLSDWPGPREGDVWVDCAPRDDDGAATVLRVLDADAVEGWLGASLCAQLLAHTLSVLRPGVSWRVVYNGAWFVASESAVVPVEADVLCAAACQVSLCAAYRGEFEGVDSQDLLAWRLSTMADAVGMSSQRAHSLFFSALAALSNEPQVYSLSAGEVIDMVGGELPLIDEAAVFSDLATLAGDPDNAAVWHLLAASPELVDAFAIEVAPAHGLTLLSRNDRQGHSAWLFGGGATGPRC